MRAAFTAFAASIKRHERGSWERLRLISSSKYGPAHIAATKVPPHATKLNIGMPLVVSLEVGYPWRGTRPVLARKLGLHGLKQHDLGSFCERSQNLDNLKTFLTLKLRLSCD